MTEEQKAELLRYRQDAAEKMADLPVRIKIEAAQAAKERRRPYPITPFTEVSPAVLGPAIDSITEVPEDISENVGTYRRVCAEQAEPFAMLSSQLLAVLDAAGIKAE